MDNELCYPSSQQRLFLRAALLKGNRAEESYQAWRADADIDKLDPGSTWLLPLLYRNLQALGIKDPFDDKYKGIHRLLWSRNHLLIDRAVRLLSALSGAGINALVFKGVSMILRYYKDYGLRRMADIDLLVPIERAKDSLEIMGKLGLKRKYPRLKPPLEVNFSVFNGDTFKIEKDLELDLHWHILADCCYKDADKDFWEKADEITIKGVKTKILCPTDELFITCIHGVRWNYMPPLRWIADAIMIINEAGAKIDWIRAIDLAKKRGLMMQFKRALQYLNQELEADIPDRVLAEIGSAPISSAERREYQVKVRPNPLGALWLHYRRYKRSKINITFLDYLQRVWRVDSVWSIPAFAIVNGFKRFRSMLSKQNPLTN